MSGMTSRLAVWIWIFMAVLNISRISAQENDTYVLTSWNSSWDNACFNNGSAVMDGIQFYPMKLPLNLNLSSIIGGVRVWFGYYQIFTYFNILGCLPSGGEHNSSIIGNTPGRCAMACSNFSYIGLEDNMCHCLNLISIRSTQFMKSATCSMIMCNGTNFICGTSGHMWVYGVNIGNTSHFDEVAKKSDNANKCVSVHYRAHDNGAAWNFTNCLDHQNSLCGLNDTTLDYATYNNSLKTSWYEAARTCFNKSERPASIELGNFRKYNLQDFNEAWTAYVRDDVIQKKGSEQSPHGRITCLSLSVSDGQSKIHFEDCQNKLPSVCLAASGDRASLTAAMIMVTNTNRNMFCILSITRTLTSTTTTAAAVTGGNITSTSIESTSSSDKDAISSTTPSSLPTTSISSVTQSSDTMTSSTSVAKLTSIGASLSSFPTFQAKETETAINEIPIVGWIGIGIGILVVIVLFVIIILRCKWTRSFKIVKEGPLSIQTLADTPYDNIKQLNGISVSEIDVKETRSLEIEAEVQNKIVCPKTVETL